MILNIKYKKVLTGQLIFLSIVILSVLGSNRLYAQEYPPRPIAIYPYQNLSFGAFFQTFSGGTVMIYPSGMRSVTGDIVEVNQGILYFPAIFEIDANPGTLLSVVMGPDVILTGSAGGTVSLHLVNTYPVAPFVTTAIPPSMNQLFVGGILTVGSPLSSPPGNYSGTFSITIIQE